MNELTITNHEGTLVANSREVAEMVAMRHGDLLEKIKGYTKILLTGEFRSVDYFMESKYTDSTGRTLPCYLITKKGCDMVANKLTGEKGVRFTATYIDRFYEMEAALANLAPRIMSPAELVLAQAQALVDLERKQQEQQTALAAVERRMDTIGDLISLNPNDWRRESKAIINRIAEALGGSTYIRDVHVDIYKVMRERFSIDVKTRLTNLRRRAAENGMCKSKRDALNALDVIAEDKKAIEAYLIIVKEMAIKYGVNKAVMGQQSK